MAEASSSDGEEDHEIDPKGKIDERRFMRTMQRHDVYEQMDIEERERREKGEKKSK